MILGVRTRVSIIDFIIKKMRRAIAIVEDTDTASRNISAGKYVLWKGVLTKASSAISSGTTLSSSNLTSLDDGAINDLDTRINTINSTVTSHGTRLSTAETNINNLKALVISGTWNSNNSLTIPGANQTSVLFAGYLQGTGSIFLGLGKSGSSLTVTNLLTGAAFSSSYVSFTLSGNNILVKSTTSANSMGVFVVGKM